MALTPPTSPAVGDPALASWADTVSADASAVFNPVSFFGSFLNVSTALPAFTNLAFSTIVEDTASAWNSTTHVWTAPSAGLYDYYIQLKCNATPVSVVVYLVKNGANVRLSPNASAVAYGGNSINGSIRLAAGDTLSVQVQSGFTTQPDGASTHSNYFQIVQRGFI